MNRDESRLISFYKMSGSGNDFIIIDNRDQTLNVGNLSTFARRVCARKISVGADGLFLIEPSAFVDFKWQFLQAPHMSPVRSRFRSLMVRCRL